MIWWFLQFGALPVFIVDGTPSPLKAQARIARYFGSCGIELTSLPVSEGVSAERSSMFSSRVQECVVRWFYFFYDYHQLDDLIFVSQTTYALQSKFVSVMFTHIPYSKNTYLITHLSDMDAGLSICFLIVTCSPVIGTGQTTWNACTTG